MNKPISLNSRIGFWLLTALCHCALALCLSSAQADPASANPSKDLKSLRNRIEKMQKQLAGNEESKESAVNALQRSEQAISQLGRTLHLTNKQHEQLLAELAELERQIQSIQAELEKQQQVLGQMLYQQYQSKQTDHLKILLSDQNPSTVMRHWHYYAYIAKARTALIAEVRDKLHKIQELAETQREKHAALLQVESSQRQQIQKLEAEKQERKTMLARLSGEIQRQRSEIGRLQADEKRLTDLMEKLEKLAKQRAAKKAEQAALRKKQARAAQSNQADRTGRTNRTHKPNTIVEPADTAEVVGSAFRSLKGKLGFPVRGELTNRFGTAREEGGTTWRGLFIKAREGEPVKAIADGQVVFSNWLRGFGNLLILDHGSGYMSLYGNNEALYKQSGDIIKAGDAIATVGNSGGNSESGVYFELRYQSKPFDPSSWFKWK